MFDLEDVLREIANGRSATSNDASKFIYVDGQIARLRENCEHYQHSQLFSIGDLVTPRKGVGLRDAGEPHILVEIDATIARQWASMPGSTAWGMRPTHRIMKIDDDTAMVHWVEAWTLEPYIATAKDDVS